MSMATGRDSCLNRFRETRPQDRVWSAAIAQGDEFTKDALQIRSWSRRRPSTSKRKCQLGSFPKTVLTTKRKTVDSIGSR